MWATAEPTARAQQKHVSAGAGWDGDPDPVQSVARALSVAPCIGSSWQQKPAQARSNPSHNIRTHATARTTEVRREWATAGEYSPPRPPSERVCAGLDCEGVGGHRAVGVLSLIGFALMLRCVETGFARRAYAASSSGAYVAASLVWQSRQR